MDEITPIVEQTFRAIMPVMSVKEAAIRRQAIIEFVKALMVAGKDYGTIPGTGDKPTLLKPGAEKLTTLFGLSPRFEIVEKVMDWTGEQHGNEPFFYLQYRCSLWQGSLLVGEGLGSSNSWEKKHRYRNAERVCPECGKATLFKSKPRPGDAPGMKYGYYCWNKKGGCGSQFPPSDPRIDNQEAGQVKNDNPADLVNTIDKMAQKRALVAATLIAVNASEFFTQDIEDMGYGDIIDGEFEEVKQVSHAPQKSPQPAAKIVAAANDDLFSPQAPERPATATTDGVQGKPAAGSVDWRKKLEGNSRPTVGTVASLIVNASSHYQSQQHALNAINKITDEKHNMSDKLEKQAALEMFDALMAHAENKQDYEQQTSRLVSELTGEVLDPFFDQEN